MIKIISKLSWSQMKSVKYLIVNKVLPKPFTTLNRSLSSVADKARVPRNYIKKGPGLEYFLVNHAKPLESVTGNPVVKEHPYVSSEELDGRGRPVYIEVYGCQMNVNDTEIVHSILKQYNYTKTDDISRAAVVLLMTCAIREGAEGKIWLRLSQIKAINHQKKLLDCPPLTVGVIGSCPVALCFLPIISICWRPLVVSIIRLHGRTVKGPAAGER